jgi:hypothetical protein
VKKVCFKTLVDEVQELEALSKDPGALVHGKRYWTVSHPFLTFLLFQEDIPNGTLFPIKCTIFDQVPPYRE